eukprot:COSAG02_NODE_6458_length_3558_cov_2.844753_6_plen_74_part_00
MSSVESVPYTVGKQIAPASQISIVHLLQTKSREARSWRPRGQRSLRIQEAFNRLQFLCIDCGISFIQRRTSRR